VEGFVTGRFQASRSVLAAALCAASMIAHQVGGKATRDAFFLSSFPVTSLPVMLIGAALVSIVVVLWTARMLTRVGPFRFVTWAFVASAVLQLALWSMNDGFPRLTSVLVYLHIASFGSILVSGFWSAVDEHFPDPRTARQQISRIGVGATLGGLAGGLLAERVAAMVGTASMLLVLAGLHLICAGLAWRVRPAQDTDTAQVASASVRDGVKLLGQVPYLRDLGLLVLVCTLGAACLDYLFKASATATITERDSLMRFFAAFYTGASLLTFLVQATLTRPSLQVPRTGPARTAATLPAGLLLGGLASFAPGLVAASGARLLESVLRSSMFRSAYELFYTPLSAVRKRASKSLIDVGFDRLGDAVAGGMIRLLLWIAPALALSFLSGFAVVLGIAGLVLVMRLYRGHRQALASSLVSRAAELDVGGIADATTRTIVLGTMDGMDLSGLRALRESAKDAEPPAAVENAPAAPPDDPLLRRIADLRSGDAQRAYRALDLQHPPPPEIVPHVVRLLAWDELAPHAVTSLQMTASRSCGQLLDALLDPEEEFAIRRRLPRVLGHCESQRAVDGLLHGLQDRRFEVRYQCGRALARLRRRGASLVFHRHTVYDAISREISVDRRVWESHRLLDGLEETSESPFEDEVLRKRSNLSLEHVFTMLSLVLDPQPLLTAYKGLLTEDLRLRGTALEYLESVLPRRVRESLWPFLDDSQPRERSADNREQILEKLLDSNASIEIEIESLRKRYGDRSS
jgi:hypothetical protein